MDDDGGTGAAGEHFDEGFLNGGGFGDEWEGVAGAHDVGDAGEEVFAEAAAGVEFGEVLGTEAAFFEEDHGEGVAKAEHVGGAGGGGEIQGAGFEIDKGVEGDVGVLSEGGV